MPSHRRHLALTLLAVGLAAGPQARAEDNQSVLVLSLAQAVEPPRLVPALLTLPSQKADGPPFPAVILVADANSPDGHLASGTEIAMAADDAWAGAQQLTDVLAHLAERREIDARRVAVVGLGSGGRLALLAGADEVAYPVLGPYGPRFVAHAALYPGCAALLDDGYARPQPWTSAPAALFVPGQDTREPPGRCEALRRELAVAGRPAARWHDYPTASYGWDIGAAYGTRTVLLPLPGGGRIRTEADAGVAVDAAERLVSFLHPLLGRPGSR